MNTKITSDVTELPSSCKSAMEHMTQALEAEDRTFEFAHIDQKCKDKIDTLEGSLSKILGKQVSLVAYERME